jgi:hypothetical protein
VAVGVVVLLKDLRDGAELPLPPHDARHGAAHLFELPLDPGLQLLLGRVHALRRVVPRQELRQEALHLRAERGDRAAVVHHVEGAGLEERGGGEEVHVRGVARVEGGGFRHAAVPRPEGLAVLVGGVQGVLLLGLRLVD